MTQTACVGAGLEPLESCLLRLDVIRNKCHIILDMFERYSCNASEDANLTKSLLSENMVLQAYHLIKVRKEMLKEKRFAEIDAIARPLVKMAIDHERDIVEVRHGYVAHIQEKGQFKKTMEMMFAGSQTPTDFAAWILLLRGIEKYAVFVAANFEEEFDAAGKKYDAQPNVDSTRSGMDLNDVDEVRRICYDVGKELQRAGFRTTVSNDVIQRMQS